MAYINATTQENRVKLFIIKASDMAGATPVKGDFYTGVESDGSPTTLNNGAILVGGLQDVTVNNATGSFRWKTLEDDGEQVITTVATNSLSGNFVLDPTNFWGDSTGTSGEADYDGIFKLSNDRTQVAFLIAPSGIVTGATPANAVLTGIGFISALSPTVSADSPVFVSPITIEVSGSYYKANA